MADDNSIWKDGAGFSTECKMLLNSYFKAFEHIIILSRGQCPEPRQFHASNSDDIQNTVSLQNAIIMDAFNNPDILPNLRKLRDKLYDLRYRAETVLCVETGPGSCLPDMAEIYFSSVDSLIDVVDNEIKDLVGRQEMKEALELSKKRQQESAKNKMDEFLNQFQGGLYDDEKEAVVSCSPEPVKVPEKPADEVGECRESFGFDVTDDVKKKLDVLFNSLYGEVIKKEDWVRDFVTFSCCLFGGDTYKDYKMKVLPKKNKCIGSFFGAMMQFTDHHNPNASILHTICKWFTDSNGNQLNIKNIQDHTTVRKADSEVWKSVKDWLTKNEKKDFKGYIS